MSTNISTPKVSKTLRTYLACQTRCEQCYSMSRLPSSTELDLPTHDSTTIQGAPIKQFPRKLYFGSCISIWAKLSKVICEYSCNVLYKFHWSNWYGLMNTTVDISKQLRFKYSRITNQTLYSFSSTVQTFQWRMSSAHSVFKQCVQNVHQLQQHRLMPTLHVTAKTLSSSYQPHVC